MMDLLERDAANWDATPLHDNLFMDNVDTEEGCPSQFVKYVAEMAIEREPDVHSLSPGKNFNFIGYVIRFQ